jgi:hypothetical protein
VRFANLSKEETMSLDEPNTTQLSYRVAALEKQVDLAARIISLEKQAAELSIYLRAAIVIAAVFGVSGAWGLKALTQARDQIAATEKRATTTQKQVDEINGRATTLAADLTKATEGIASLGTVESITSRVETVVNQVASPANLTQRFTPTVNTIATGLIRNAIPHPVKVELNNTSCGWYTQNDIRCFVDTGSMNPALVSIADSGSWPAGTVSARSYSLKGKQGLIITAHFATSLNGATGNKFYVNLYQPGRASRTPNILPVK